jgi:hypothetical protein
VYGGIEICQKKEESKSQRKVCLPRADGDPVLYILKTGSNITLRIS